jgi:hypothetical protein
MAGARGSGKRRILTDSVRIGPAMRASLGRSLQLVGLVLLPVGLFHGFEGGPNAMALEIGFLVAGVAVFLAGWRLGRGS